MKKRFTKILSLVLVAVAAMSLSITSFAADNKPAPITPTAETTLGDVCRHFEVVTPPAGYIVPGPMYDTIYVTTK